MTNLSETALPLNGIRILDFTANMAGPFATQTLGDQGADVIKVEPPDGDVSRTLGDGADRYSAFFANLNRSKRSITLNLAHSGAGAVFERLLDWADVVVHSFRPGPARRFGLEPDLVRARRPAVIHTTITGFGSVGPYAGRPAYDHVIQALAGFATVQADPRDGTPILIRQGVVDKLVGQAAAQAITAALFERTRTGIGRALEIRMLDIALAFLWPDVMMNHTVAQPSVCRPSIARSFRLTRTMDGHLAFVLVTKRQFERLAQAIGVEESVDQAAVLRATVRHLARCTTSAGVDFLSSFEIPVAPVMELDNLHEHPQIRASGVVDEYDHPVLGSVRQPGPAVRFAGTTGAGLRAPNLGEHTAQIAADIGLSEHDLEQLRSSGIFGP